MPTKHWAASMVHFLSRALLLSCYLISLSLEISEYHFWVASGVNDWHTLSYGFVELPPSLGKLTRPTTIFIGSKFVSGWCCNQNTVSVSATYRAYCIIVCLWDTSHPSQDSSHQGWLPTYFSRDSINPHITAPLGWGIIQDRRYPFFGAR